MVYSNLSTALASVSGGDIGGMAALVENEDANEYVRGAGLKGLLTLCACGTLGRDEVMDYFKSLFQKLRRTPDGVWSWLATSCADLCPEEVMEELGQAYDEDLPDPGVIGWDEVEEALAMGKEAAMSRLRRSRYSLVSDVHKEMSWWAASAKTSIRRYGTISRRLRNMRWSIRSIERSPRSDEIIPVRAAAVRNTRSVAAGR
jgi:hypothetical protein